MQETRRVNNRHHPTSMATAKSALQMCFSVFEMDRKGTIFRDSCIPESLTSFCVYERLMGLKKACIMFGLMVCLLLANQYIVMHRLLAVLQPRCQSRDINLPAGEQITT